MLFSGPRSFARGLAVLGLTWTGRATLSFLYGYSTEATARPAGELGVELGRRRDVRLFAGRQARGRACVSGSCREVPPFDGARLEVVLRF